MRNWMYRLMAGRYGQDPLNQFILILSLAFLLLSFLWAPLYVFGILLMAVSLFRMLSRNIARRRAEAAAFNRLWARVAGFFRRGKNRAVGSRTHRYYKCPSCGQQLRVPKGKGRVSVHCPKCNTNFEKST